LTGIGHTQGRCLHTGQHKHRINAHIHPYLKWDSNPRTQCSRWWRHYVQFLKSEINPQILWDLHRINEYAEITDLPPGAWAWYTHVKKKY
jgi:hypothetical protein